MWHWYGYGYYHFEIHMYLPNVVNTQNPTRNNVMMCFLSAADFNLILIMYYRKSTNPKSTYLNSTNDITRRAPIWKIPLRIAPMLFTKRTSSIFWNRTRVWPGRKVTKPVFWGDFQRVKGLFRYLFPSYFHAKKYRMILSPSSKYNLA